MFNLSFMERSRNNFLSAPVAGRAEGPTTEGPINEIPVQVLFSIFLKAREDLGRMACVNKRWNAIAYGEPLYKELYSIINPTGRADWIAQKFGDPGEEPRIPLEWLAKIEIGKHLLTLVPKSVVKGNGEEIFITALSMGKMWAERRKIKEPQDRPGYINKSWGEAIDDRPAEETHWVWLSKKVIGYTRTYLEQQVVARKQGGEVSELVDTIVTMLMAHAKTRKKYFVWDPENNIIKILRIQDQIARGRLVVGFAPAGLFVYYMQDNANTCVGVLVARKSIGH